MTRRPNCKVGFLIPLPHLQSVDIVLSVIIMFMINSSTALAATIAVIFVLMIVVVRTCPPFAPLLLFPGAAVLMATTLGGGSIVSVGAARPVFRDDMEGLINGACGAGEEGWVPTEDYERAVTFFRAFQEEALAGAKSVEEREEIEGHWPWDDMDEEMYM